MDELIRLLMAAVVKYKASSKSREYFTENFEKEESSGFRGLSAILQKRSIFEFVWQQCKTFYIFPPLAIAINTQVLSQRDICAH